MSVDCITIRIHQIEICNVDLRTLLHICGFFNITYTRKPVVPFGIWRRSPLSSHKNTQFLYDRISTIEWTGTANGGMVTLSLNDEQYNSPPCYKTSIKSSTNLPFAVHVGILQYSHCGLVPSPFMHQGRGSLYKRLFFYSIFSYQYHIRSYLEDNETIIFYHV